MKFSTLAMMTLFLCGLPSAHATETKATYENVSALVGVYEGTSSFNSETLPDCKVEITESIWGLSVKITQSDGIRIFDKYAREKERIAASATQNISAWSKTEIYGSREDMSVWNRKTHLNLTEEKWVARFSSPQAGSLNFVQLSYNLDEFGFFKGPEVSYSTGCYQLKRSSL